MTSAGAADFVGGIDLGGTKIEAALFDSTLHAVAKRRTATPHESFEALLEALADQHRWLCEQAGAPDLRVGFGLPGLVEAGTGLSLASNLPSRGKPLASELSRRLGYEVPVENDCKCFVLSEANGGGGEDYETVFGLILGTGCGGGVCFRGELVRGYNNLPGEIGHLGIPAAASPGRALPVLPCKCGRHGCYETLISGPGLAALGRHLHGLELSAEQLCARADAGDEAARDVLGIWTDIVCELLRTIQSTVDPDCIVFGGGLSGMPGLVEQLVQSMPRHMIRGTHLPALRIARFGDSSGVRGAAMLALPARVPAARGAVPAQ